jgi:hypothetical protein
MSLVRKKKKKKYIYIYIHIYIQKIVRYFLINDIGENVHLLSPKLFNIFDIITKIKKKVLSTRKDKTLTSLLT